MLDILQLHVSVKNPTVVSISYAMLLAFILSTGIAITYRKTFQGLSYSRNFIQTLILSSIVVCIAMQAIGDNIARGFGMMGALAIIRFRSSLKDPKDMIYVFAALSVGIACGVYQFSIAVVGSIFFILCSYVLYYLPIGSDVKFDGLLKFNIKSKDQNSESKIRSIMEQYCQDFALVTLRELSQGSRLDFSYQVKIKKKESYQNFIQQFNDIEDIQGLALLLQESTIEI